MAEVIEDEYDLKAKKELSAEAYKSWPLIWENSHLVKTRDYWLAVDFLETYEEYRLLKSKLKPKRGSKEDPRIHENSNGTVQTSPLKNQLKDIQIELRNLTKELALSPTSAANLKLLNDYDSKIISDILSPVRRGV